MYQTVLVEKKDRVATITLNRPDKLNSITAQLQGELIQALDELAADDDVMVALLTGAGRAFCTGYDVSTMRDAPEELSRAGDIILSVVSFAKPIIAAVNGYALAQGFQMALATDIIIASEKALFGSIGAVLNEICDYAVFALPRIVGRNRAAEMLFTCDHISGEEAFKMGLANRVVPAEQLMQVTQEFADRIKTKAPLSLKYTKQALRKGEYGVEERDWVNKVKAKLAPTEDRREAFTAIIEKRTPVFKGR